MSRDEFWLGVCVYLGIMVAGFSGPMIKKLDLLSGEPAKGNLSLTSIGATQPSLSKTHKNPYLEARTKVSLACSKQILVANRPVPSHALDPQGLENTWRLKSNGLSKGAKSQGEGILLLGSKPLKTPSPGLPDGKSPLGVETTKG